MTRSEFIRKRCEPLFVMIEKFVHEEERSTVRGKMELWILRLVTDLEHMSSTDISEMSDRDFERYGDTPV